MAKVNLEVLMSGYLLLCRKRRKRKQTDSKIENAFGILANRYRLFLGKILLQPDIAEKAVLVCCALHNMLAKEVNSSAEQMTDSRDSSTHQPLPGEWKDDPILNQAAPPTGTNVTKRGKDQREYLTQYFSVNST